MGGYAQKNKRIFGLASPDRINVAKWWMNLNKITTMEWLVTGQNCSGWNQPVVGF
jgi:hypothetical protein